MKETLHKRRALFRQTCLKYARYVFNDHFVLFLLVFIGFLSLQYRNLLQQLPDNTLPIFFFLGLILFFLIPLGRIATYLEEADRLFLLAKEESLSSYLQEQMRSSFLLWIVFQTGILLILLPLLFALGFAVWHFVVLLVASLFLKWWFFQGKLHRFFPQNQLDWQYAIDYEKRRKQRILRFFSLFTTVKGLSNSVKRRAYLDGLLRLFPKEQKKTWQHLFLRSYLRNGEFLALTLRLACLAVLVLLGVKEAWIAVAFVLLFNYLLLFQLTALYHAFDYQYLSLLFPLGQKEKEKAVTEVIRGVGYSLLFLETLFTFSFFSEKLPALFLVVTTLILYLIYLPFKIKRLVDEKG